MYKNRCSARPTICYAAVAMSAIVREVDLRRLRIALMSLGGPPQAQRHHVRAGLLQRACATIEEVRGQLPALELGGAVDAEQAASLAAVAARLEGLKRSWRERMLPDAASLGFDFLLGDAFEDPEWESLRLAARAAFTVLRAADNPRIG
jgi:hypothetical protein